MKLILHNYLTLSVTLDYKDKYITLSFNIQAELQFGDLSLDYYNESLIVFCLLTCSLFGICLKLITLEIIILAKSLLFLIVDILTYIVLLHTEDDNRVKQTWFEVYFVDWFADRGERPVVSSCPLPWNLKFEKIFLTLDRIEKSSHFSE
jgi:hypothetical protein